MVPVVPIIDLTHMTPPPAIEYTPEPTTEGTTTEDALAPNKIDDVEYTNTGINDSKHRPRDVEVNMLEPEETSESTIPTQTKCGQAMQESTGNRLERGRGQRVQTRSRGMNAPASAPAQKPNPIPKQMPTKADEDNTEEQGLMASKTEKQDQQNIGEKHTLLRVLHFEGPDLPKRKSTAHVRHPLEGRPREIEPLTAAVKRGSEELRVDWDSDNRLIELITFDISDKKNWGESKRT
ncbi:hypothetical protein BDZ91DRAFT_799038 [Kalaharituber pfeilii]|nr:hypothetical protein BDZ91DRAFT_799038 [Kalaharituber pfeilii]